MSAEVETIAYSGAVPWHGLGFEVRGDLSPVEMLKAAQLDWTVSKRPLYTVDTVHYKTQPFNPLIYDKLFSLVRDSDNRILGVCGPRYEPFQNSETFDFFRKFTEAGGMSLEVAGSLKGGTWVWALARLRDGSFSLDDDKNHSFLLLVSPHIWGESLTIKFTSVRVVCWNTLTSALNEKVSDYFRCRHTASFQNVRHLAEESVENALHLKDEYEKRARVMAETHIKNMEDVHKYINEVEKTVYSITKRSKKEIQLITNFYTGVGSDLVAAKGTWWGAFNAITYFYDHQGGRGGNDLRLYNAWLDHGIVAKKNRAFNLAFDYAQAA